MAFDFDSIIPEGWEAVGYRRPQEGETYLAVNHEKIISPMVRDIGCSPAISSIILKRKRWRAKVGGRYYLVGADIDVFHAQEEARQVDGNRYELGNYFEAETGASDAAEKIKALLKGTAEQSRK